MKRITLCFLSIKLIFIITLFICDNLYGQVLMKSRVSCFYCPDLKNNTFYQNYHDFKVGANLYNTEYHNSFNISYGHNVRYANIGASMTYMTDNINNKKYLLGEYLKLSPYSFGIKTKKSLIVFYIISGLNYNHTLPIFNSKAKLNYFTFNLGFIVKYLPRSIAIEFLVSRDFNISASFDKNLVIPIIGIHYPNTFYPKINIHYFLKHYKK